MNVGPNSASSPTVNYHVILMVTRKAYNKSLNPTAKAVV
jgi:hypothetical protein